MQRDVDLEEERAELRIIGSGFANKEMVEVMWEKRLCMWPERWYSE